MTNVKIEFSYQDNDRTISFFDLKDIVNEETFDIIKNQILTFDKKIKDAAIVHLLNQEVGKENAKQIAVDVKVFEQKRELFVME
ncbi:hypothetical protein M670_04648 [Schinkia azotoformans MEV2011]|uniref:DUF2922 domain-containing protein n=1 Tax=Schinkia azotoformans MEV2011 TaxID=1348973 RepID=A0A072NSK3_SCHAZ|nr:hypothetical protein [Schinkia azotoformans]KEF36195.1 hypothetical protein M670_04648 [Schinkia azotoformans MEV2011]MEC1727564.1 hypothetical protein [Schinkia azotoformans]MEC1743661.1 hypothetical protein [Schinkia azotoformans]MEC1768907.1 hypothetical protein [Schinkia azotoformans]MEC1772342.1 hypothetical protein [Schinkia azotoformans]